MHFKILPMGASIVYGLMSSDGNGFRLALQDHLVNNGTAATMVGTQSSGNMSDNHHEACEYHGGESAAGLVLTIVLQTKRSPSLD